MRITLLGHGGVGGALAEHLVRLGHEVTIGTPPERRESAGALLARLPGLRMAAPAEAVTGADLVILAVPFGVVEAVLAPLAPYLRDRILVDATNPVDPGLRHGLDGGRSGAEHVAQVAAGARVVKAFSVYGAENLARPPHPGAPLPPIMPIAGDDDDAKAVVAGLLTAMGWRPLDTGPLAQAVHLEHLTLLWIRMVRVGGHPANLTWAALPA